MINSKRLRLLRNSGAFEERNENKSLSAVLIVSMFVVVILTFILLLSSCAMAGQISDIQAVRAVLGEAENESFTGKVAIGEVLRTRGSLKGIYGYNAIKYVNGKYYRGKRLISSIVALQALKAWKLSANTNYALNAQGWGNASDLKVFKRQKWFSKCIIVAKIGSHYFWRAKA